MKSEWKTLGFGAAVSAAVLVVAIGAPYLYAEYRLRRHDALVGPPPTQAIEGRWYDDYFVVQPLDATTFAIGEPRYYQGNYSYLIIGAQRAVLFDAGSGARDIVPVVRSLTTLPVTVIPSHLHFDHVGALGRLDRTALLDVGSLKARIQDRQLTLERYEFLGFADDLPTPHVIVQEWFVPGTRIDLGGRQLQILHTPGHTPTSASLYDSERRQLFCGDFVYPGRLYAFLPGASRSAYLATVRQLLTALDPQTRLYTAHMADEASSIAAPVLKVEDLRALAGTLTAIEAGTAPSHGFYPRVFTVNGALTFATGFPWNNR